MWVGRASVIDGDTLEIHGQRIRIWGADAVESRQNCVSRDAQSWACGRRAAAALSDWIGQRTVTCNVIDRDRYGRAVARCAVGGADVGAWLVRNGWALDYTTYSKGAYKPFEREAAAARRGIHSGTFDAPWEWRKTKDTLTVAPSPPPLGGRPGCTIKGNISSKAERIYHVPGQENYDRTQINLAHGERWFCSEAEAVSAGWRKAAR
ncbi:thermonuclease family protein [Caulobacter sp. 17J65-9]|nr:thermonuclease family protein [Caulobacter sp. 17J65-9]